MYGTALTSPDHCLPCWLRAAGHQARTLHWPRRHRPHIPRCRPTVALLQQEPRGLAPSAQCISLELQYRRGRPEGWIDAMSRVGTCAGTDQRNIMAVFVAHSFDDFAGDANLLSCSHDLL